MPSTLCVPCRPLLDRRSVRWSVPFLITLLLPPPLFYALFPAVSSSLASLSMAKLVGLGQVVFREDNSHSVPVGGKKGRYESLPGCVRLFSLVNLVSWVTLGWQLYLIENLRLSTEWVPVMPQHWKVTSTKHPAGHRTQGPSVRVELVRAEGCQGDRRYSHLHPSQIQPNLMGRASPGEAEMGVISLCLSFLWAARIPLSKQV